MTKGNITELQYWLDLLIKGGIGIVVSLIGMDYRQVKTSLQELEQSKYRITMEVQVMQNELSGVKDRLDRIEKKLDRVLDR